MESTPEIQYNNPLQKQGFSIGDLLTHPDHGRGILIDTESLLAEYWADYHTILDERGKLHTARLWQTAEKWKRSHSTGLTYQYQNPEQVQRDYQAGLFTPYFEIL